MGRDGISENNAEELISNMKRKASKPQYIEINEDNWIPEIETPLGVVKMGKHKKLKLFKKERSEQYGLVVESLSNPDIVLEEWDKEPSAKHERPNSYLLKHS